MSNLRDALVRGGRGNQFIGFGERRRYRLFNQDINTASQQRTSHCEVLRRRHRDGRRFGSSPREQLIHAAEDRDVSAMEVCGNALGPRAVLVNKRGQARWLAGGLELRVNASMIAAKGAAADHDDGD
jgi:hypothetical protein